MRPARRHRSGAFTLIELLVAVSVVAIVLTLAAPSFYDFILRERLKGVSAQLVTDLQLARSETVSRNYFVRIVFAADSNVTCYTVYTNPWGASTGQRCDCRLGPGAACSNGSVEVRTVQVPRSSSVRILTPTSVDAIAFDPVTGGLLSIPSDIGASPLENFTVETSIDSSRLLRTTVGRAGKVSVCGASANLGAPPC